MLFYHDNNVDVGCYYQVESDNTMYHVVHYNHWLNLRFKRLPITLWFPFTKSMCLWKFYISANWWKSSTDCRPYTNNYNLVIFNRWLFAMLGNIFGRVWCIVKSIFFGCRCSLTYLNLIVLIGGNERKNNWYIVINSFQVNMAKICEL